MKIIDAIAEAYLKGQDVACFSGEWFYTGTNDSGKITNLFTQPKTDTQTHEKVKTVYDTIYGAADRFEPTNRRVWDALFPDWPEVLDDISVNLVVGFPERYDAMVKTDAAGKLHIIFDLGSWACYVGHCDLPQVVQNLMTHELCHVLLHMHTDGLEDAQENAGYRIQLDAITFDEGFAHLVSYNAMEIDAVDWHSEKLMETWEHGQKRMRQALIERDPELQQKNLYEANIGPYFDKYACMCGMLYLAQVWLDGGIPALQKEFENGFRGFAEKTIDNND